MTEVLRLFGCTTGVILVILYWSSLTSLFFVILSFKGVIVAKHYEILSNGKESYMVKAYDNGDEYIHNDLNENEMLDLEHTYLVNGFIIKPNLYWGG
jgi:hypothetical protein